MHMNNDTNDNNIYKNIQQPEALDNASYELVNSKKTKGRKKRRKKYYTLKFLIFVVVCVALYFFAHSAVFTVKNIQLEDNDRFTLKKVKNITGLKKGVNLFEINTGECEDKLEENPYIREAEVSRKIPDTVNISLDLRVPVAAIKSNKKYILFDNEGIVVDIREKLPYYTIFAQLTVKEGKEGEKLKVKEEKKYQEYCQLLDEMNKADLYFRKIVIGEKKVKLYVRENLYCIGEKDNVIAGMQDGNLKAVLFRLNEKGVKKGIVEMGDDQYYSYSKAKK